ncbi:MAG: cytidine deaminase [Candidatus Gastranaerophilales bacterium]|nr:cytidine deaminase [Candidatus Gastranaerophilales bacterium]
MINDYELLNIAKEASQTNYAPYSNFNVGACALFDSGKIYKGSNIENVSYGLSLCAERNAISSGISNGETILKKIAIYSPNSKLCYPCGACRQWIMEFSSTNKNEVAQVILEGENSEIKTFSIEELLPFCFKM